MPYLSSRQRRRIKRGWKRLMMIARYVCMFFALVLIAGCRSNEVPIPAGTFLPSPPAACRPSGRHDKPAPTLVRGGLLF